MADIPETVREEHDPRTSLFDALQDLFLSAIEQEEAVRAAIQQGRPLPPGSLYKVDGDRLKIHLQPPAEDVAFNEGAPEAADEETAEAGVEVPRIWGSIPIPPEGSRTNSILGIAELTALIHEAPQMTIHVLQGEGNDDELMQFTVRRDYFSPYKSPLMPDDEWEVVEPIDEDQQRREAQTWLELLISRDYTLRSMGETRSTAA